MDSPSPTLQACWNILQKTPPSESAETIAKLKCLLATNPDALAEVSKTLFPLPLNVETDPTTKKNFLKCELNRVGNSYRSPWSNALVPTSDDEVPADSLRPLEAVANEVWDAYKQLYYRNDSVGSVYLYETELSDGSFTGVFLIQKDVTDETQAHGQWNSVHLVHVGPVSDGKSKYHVQSTIQVTINPSEQADLGARLTKETIQECAVSGPGSHLENLGKIIETTEIEMRSSVENLHIPKLFGVAEGIRKEVRKTGVLMGSHSAMLQQAVLARATKK